MSGHAIDVYLTADPAVSIAMVCLEPPEAACRLTCPNGCEVVAVCGQGTWQCDLDEHPDEPHCAFCDATFGWLEPGDCHIVNWIDDVPCDYAGPARTFRISAEIDWEEYGATWSLPEKPTVEERQ